jgi:hypothetical protein
VVQEAEVEVLDTTPVDADVPFWDEPWLHAMAGEQVGRGTAARRLAAAHLDSLARLLGVARVAQGRSCQPVRSCQAE